LSDYPKKIGTAKQFLHKSGCFMEFQQEKHRFLHKSGCFMEFQRSSTTISKGAAFGTPQGRCVRHTARALRLRSPTIRIKGSLRRSIPRGFEEGDPNVTFSRKHPASNRL